MGPLPVLVHSEMRGIDCTDKCPIFSRPPNSPCFSKGSCYSQALRVGSQWDRVRMKQVYVCECCPGLQPHPVSRAQISRPTQFCPSPVTHPQTPLPAFTGVGEGFWPDGRTIKSACPKTRKRKRTTKEEFFCQKQSLPHC